MQEINLNNQKFILRECKDSDFEFTFNLLKENMYDLFMKNWGFWNENSFKENFRKENIRIIELDNKSIGYIDFKFKKDRGYINDIQIIPKFQNLGIGTEILKLLETETLNYGLNKIGLKTFKNNKAINLYKKFEYYSISEDDTSLIMEKILK